MWGVGGIRNAARLVVRAAIALSAALGMWLAFGGSPTSGGIEPPAFTCEYSPTDHALSIHGLQSFGNLILDRNGDTILPLSQEDVPPDVPIPCTGGTPTVNNTDSITLSEDPGTRENRLILSLADRLAPGFTDEGDGSSEIEIHIATRNCPPITCLWAVFLIGTPRSDAVTHGATAEGPGLNLNPREATADADLTYGAGTNGLLFHSGGGSDSIRPAARDGQFTGPFSENFEVNSGPGPDNVRTGPRGDNVYAGTGRDQVVTGDGRDDVYVRDGQHDQVNCGPGRDAVFADYFGDRIRNCEFD
jgi:hypothetical protein